MAIAPIAIAGRSRGTRTPAATGSQPGCNRSPDEVLDHLAVRRPRQFDRRDDVTRSLRTRTMPADSMATSCRRRWRSRHRGGEAGASLMRRRPWRPCAALLEAFTRRLVGGSTCARPRQCPTTERTESATAWLSPVIIAPDAERVEGIDRLFRFGPDFVLHGIAPATCRRRRHTGPPALAIPFFGDRERREYSSARRRGPQRPPRDVDLSTSATTRKRLERVAVGMTGRGSSALDDGGPADARSRPRRRGESKRPVSLTSTSTVPLREVPVLSRSPYRGAGPLEARRSLTSSPFWARARSRWR